MTDLSEEIKKFETDILNISTQTPFSKKKTLDRLNQNLEIIKKDEIQLNQLNELLFLNENKIYNIFLNLLNDNLEKSKTISLNYLIEIKILNTDLINKLIFQLDEMIKNDKSIEEINYLIIKLLIKLVENSNSNIISINCDKISKISKTILMENSPDQKEIASKLIQSVSDKIPNRIIYFSAELIAPLISNMGNRQQRVRLESLNALTSLALSGSIKIIDTLEPHLILLANDNSPAIRIQLCQSIEKWSTKIPTSTQYYEFLLPILIGLSVSDINQVRFSAINSLNAISQYYHDNNNNNNNEKNQFDENTIKSFNQLNDQLQQQQQQSNKELVSNSLRYYLQTIDNDTNISIESKKLIFQFSQSIMKRYYRDFHNQELDQNIREFKINFLLGFVSSLGGLPTTRFIDAIIEIISVRFIDHFDQISKKVNELVFILGLIQIDEKILVSRIIEKIKSQLLLQESHTIDIQLLQILLLILKKYYSSYLLINNNLSINSTTTSQFYLLIDQFKILIFKDLTLSSTTSTSISFLNDFILSFLNQIFNSNNNNLIITDKDDNSLLNLLKLLILIDNKQQSNINGISNLELFDSISIKCGFTNFIEYLEKNCEKLIKEISSKDKNQLVRQKSHLLILNYLLEKLPSTILNQYSDLINLIKNK